MFIPVTTHAKRLEMGCTRGYLYEDELPLISPAPWSGWTEPWEGAFAPQACFALQSRPNAAQWIPPPLPPPRRLSRMVLVAYTFLERCISPFILRWMVSSLHAVC